MSVYRSSVRCVALGVFGLVGVAAGLVGPACSDRTTEQVCYPRDASLDVEFDPLKGESNPYYCDWKVTELPDPPDGYAFTTKVFLAIDPATEGPCDVERFDALLRAKIEEECDQPYELLRGCYIPEEETRNGHCWVAGLYFSNCDVP